MTGIYFNGNGKHQSTLNEILQNTRINIRTRNSLMVKVDVYNKFYVNGLMSDEVKRNAINKYHSIGSIEMAVAAYIEEDMDKFLKRVQTRYKL